MAILFGGFCKQIDITCEENVEPLLEAFKPF
jgi:hypothetical protein